MSTTPKNNFARLRTVDIEAAANFLNGSKTSQVAEADRVAEEGVPMSPPPPAPAPMPVAVAAPRASTKALVVMPPAVGVTLRPDGTPASDRLPVQVNFKMVEARYWRVKDMVDRTPRMSMRQFLEEAAMEKLARMEAELLKK